ncbi:hypothetical protein HUG20_09145 [Salicibibacter cibi]|uniref:Uncharacterized protein n=1 Tax=Salicibibacter cibi TaxID=2743001 RepID=A0A7T6ZAQ1_9BACI|nr:hypothetical protein HUG20_09145 [Salicibibacter cibi]
MADTEHIENYPGYDPIYGADLSNKMFGHAKKFGTEYAHGNIKIEDIVDQKVCQAYNSTIH